MTVKESLQLKPGDKVIFRRLPQGRTKSDGGFTIGRIYTVKKIPEWANKDTPQSRNTILVTKDDEGTNTNGWQAYCFEKATKTAIILFGDNNE